MIEKLIAETHRYFNTHIKKITPKSDSKHSSQYSNHSKQEHSNNNKDHYNLKDSRDHNNTKDHNNKDKEHNTAGPSILPPPNPLIQRKHIPLNSPKFGKNSNYIKLMPFLKEEIEKEEIKLIISNSFPNGSSSPIKEKENPNSPTNSSEEKFEKACELSLYINNASMLGKIIYLKNDLTKESKINLDNIVNLKKKNSEIPKKNKTVKPYYIPNDSKDTTLIFESRFECGNLLASFIMSDNNYQMIIQNDTNTNGYSQWFFYRVTNVKKGVTAKFNIINMMKKYSLYRRGMKILIYSEKKAAKENVGWYRGGENIQYYSNQLYKFVRERRRTLYSLSFNYEFEYDNDTVYFANSLPYTYTELMKELNEFQKNDTKYDYFYRKALCSTLAGNYLDYFTITSSEKNNGENLKQHFYDTNLDNKKGVVIMARVHPGESVSSWMMKGVMDFLTSDYPEAVFLRKNFVFKIIPMMNPDGVITGNYRTSLAGCDLNRRWICPNEVLHPEIFYAKQMINKLASIRKLSLICDLHGHSGAHNIFTYGNNIKEDHLLCKFFPFILSKINPTFNFNQCGFNMPKDKLGTARINLFNEMNMFENIFTIEASFSGCNIKGVHENVHFNSNYLTEMGRDVCRALVTYQYAFENGNYDFSMLLKNSFLNGNVSSNNNSESTSTENTININSINSIFNNGNNNANNGNSVNKKLLLTDKSTLTKDLMAELELKEKIKKENKEKMNNINKSLILSEGILFNNSDDSSKGSDSEPSVDNYENEFLLKLLPTQAKKKKKKTKKIKNQLYSRIPKSKKDVRPGLNEGINNNNQKNEKMRINLNNNLQNQITSLNKSYVNNIVKNDYKNKLIVLSDRTNSIFNNKEESPKKIPKDLINKDLNPNAGALPTKRKKDQETQTEEIFFKYHWSFFLSQNFTVLGAKTTAHKNVYPTKTSNMISDIKNSLNNISNYYTKSFSGKKEMSFYGNININPLKNNFEINQNSNNPSNANIATSNNANQNNIPITSTKRDMEYHSNKINFNIRGASGNTRNLNNIPNINLMSEIKGIKSNPKAISIEKYKINSNNINYSKNININLSGENFINSAMNQNDVASKGNSLIKTNR